MIQEITDGILAALDEAFPGAKLYDETAKQNLQTPCFIIRCINPVNQRHVGNRYWRECLFSIQYLPESGTGAHAACYAVQDKLYLALEYVAVEGRLQRGTGMRGELLDGTLTFLVSYNMFVTAGPAEEGPMGEIAYTGGIKNAEEN